MFNAKKDSLDDFTNAMAFILSMVQKYCYVNYHVENWIFIVECKGAGITDFPKTAVKKMIEVTTINYQCNLEKMYIMNPSSTLKLLFDMFKGFLDSDTKSKISMIKEKNRGELKEYIPEDQLEAKYGGKLPDPTQFWPPYTTMKGEPWTVTLKKREEEEAKKKAEAEAQTKTNGEAEGNGHSQSNGNNTAQEEGQKTE
mmetsp:Transcript_36075/g.32461  ORF Transcript_36075/g.32461 Transcript_36075/m.32461 type:complete len:198 (+) Transcript_36075:455-1048(+)